MIPLIAAQKKARKLRHQNGMKWEKRVTVFLDNNDVLKSETEHKMSMTWRQLLMIHIAVSGRNQKFGNTKQTDINQMFAKNRPFFLLHSCLEFLDVLLPEEKKCIHKQFAVLTICNAIRFVYLIIFDFLDNLPLGCFTQTIFLAILSADSQTTIFDVNIYILTVSYLF